MGFCVQVPASSLQLEAFPPEDYEEGFLVAHSPGRWGSEYIRIIKLLQAIDLDVLAEWVGCRVQIDAKLLILQYLTCRKVQEWWHACETSEWGVEYKTKLSDYVCYAYDLHSMQLENVRS